MCLQVKFYFHILHNVFCWKKKIPCDVSACLQRKATKLLPTLYVYLLNYTQFNLHIFYRSCVNVWLLLYINGSNTTYGKRTQHIFDFDFVPTFRSIYSYKYHVYLKQKIEGYSMLMCCISHIKSSNIFYPFIGSGCKKKKIYAKLYIFDILLFLILYLQYEIE